MLRVYISLEINLKTCDIFYDFDMSNVINFDTDFENQTSKNI